MIRFVKRWRHTLTLAVILAAGLVGLGFTLHWAVDCKNSGGHYVREFTSIGWTCIR